MDDALSCGSSNLEAMDAAQSYQAAMTRLLTRQMGLRSGLVLDFGAGAGTYTRLAAAKTNWDLCALEPNRDLHHSFEGLSVRSSLEAIPLASLDGAFSLNVFEHIADDVAALRQLAARCRPGAPIFILVPAHMKLWSPMDDLVGHVRRYSMTGLERLGRAAGLAVSARGWFDATGYFATLAYRLAARAGVLERADGSVSSGQVKAFDRVFALAEPAFKALGTPFGKNCWVTLHA